MKTAATLFCVLFMTISAFADVYSIAKQQARGVANSESSKPGGTAPSAPPPQNNNPAPNPVLEATLQNITSLRADLANLETNKTDTQSLKNDLAAAATGVKPSNETIAKLVEDLAAAMNGNKIPDTQKQKLAQFLHAIFNSSHLSPTQQETVIDGVQKILHDGGASDYDADKVVTDLKKIATTTG
ncbi:MAG TPA: hypothetical protein VHG89_01385 [Verrucomicrobiae bacterium]|nr:hypothetical protein [Verrucomicrobiae bacterium]